VLQRNLRWAAMKGDVSGHVNAVTMTERSVCFGECHGCAGVVSERWCDGDVR